MNYKIAIIVPLGRGDSITDTVLDGLIEMAGHREVIFKTSTFLDSYVAGANDSILDRNDFIRFARDADLIFLFYGKKVTDIPLASEIGMWEKTLFFDGSEVGKNERFNFTIQRDILALNYEKYGGIKEEMLIKCPLYFRREKPYIKGIVPLPFGIDSAYVKHFDPKKRKDIDFTCVFGQDEYPLMRRYCRELLVEYCKRNGFTSFTSKTANSDEFHKILARSKVGISIGGGGYDTMRFWEILGNNCLLLTERIDIYQPDSRELRYGRIWQFNNLFDFQYQLEKISALLRGKYNQDDLIKEYQEILSRHSSVARVKTVLQKANEKGIIK